MINKSSYHGSTKGTQVIAKVQVFLIQIQEKLLGIQAYYD